MATIEENVRELQAKLEEAEKQLLEKQERETLAREKSWEYNIDAIQSNIKAATTSITASSRPRTPWVDDAGKVQPGFRAVLTYTGGEERRVCNYLQPFMTSVLKCLQRLDERIQAIELKNVKIKGRI